MNELELIKTFFMVKIGQAKMIVNKIKVKEIIKKSNLPVGD